MSLYKGISLWLDVSGGPLCLPVRLILTELSPTSRIRGRLFMSLSWSVTHVWSSLCKENKQGGSRGDEWMKSGSLSLIFHANYSHKKILFKLLIWPEDFHKECTSCCEKVVFFFFLIRGRMFFSPNIAQSQGFVGVTSFTTTTTSTTMAEKLIICVSRHRALFDKKQIIKATIFKSLENLESSSKGATDTVNTFRTSWWAVLTLQWGGETFLLYSSFIFLQSRTRSSQNLR